MTIPGIRDALGPTPEWLERCRARMARVDSLAPELRALVHEFGSTIINDFLNCGVTDPRRIKHLILRVSEGASSQNSNGTSGLIRNRCADLGMLVAGMQAEGRQECITAFLRHAESRK